RLEESMRAIPIEVSARQRMEERTGAEALPAPLDLHRSPAAQPRYQAGGAFAPFPNSVEAVAGSQAACSPAAPEIRVALEDARQDRRIVFALERPSTSEHFVEHAAKRPDVGAFVHRKPARLLRTHIGRGPDDHSRPRPIRRYRRNAIAWHARCGPYQLREPEVEHLDHELVRHARHLVTGRGRVLRRADVGPQPP